MKKTRFILVCLLVLLVSAFALVGCGGKSEYAVSYSTQSTEMGTVTCKTAEGQVVASGSQVAENTLLTFSATANEGYAFEGWYSSTLKVSSSATFTHTVISDVNFVAKFNASSYALSFSSENSSYGTVNCQSLASGDLVDFGTEVTLTATPVSGYNFIGWFIEGESQPVSTSAEYTFNMTAFDLNIEAKFKAEKRTVTYYDGYDRLKISFVDYGTPFDNYQPLKANYNFAGWFVNATLTQAYNSSTLVTENITLYAKFDEIIPIYEVIFVDEDGSQIGGTQLIARGDEILSRPASPVKEGYNFVAWMYYDEEQGKDVVLALDKEVESDMIIKATYEIKKINVKLYKTDADYATSRAYIDVQIDYGTKFSRPATPTHTSNTLVFSKWVYCVDKSLAFDFDSEITEDVELIASWVDKPINTHTVKFFDEGENVTPLDTQVIEHGKSAIAPAEPVREGYEFTGWDIEFDVVESDLIIHATYTIKSFTVVFKDFDGSEISKQTIEYNQSVVVPADRAREGYTFTGWSVTELTAIKSDLEVIAEYAINKYTVVFYNEQTEIETQANINHGAYATIPQTPSISGYSFEGWYKDSSFNEKFDFNVPVTQSQSVYAKFVEIQIVTYTVTFVDGSSIISTQTVLEGGSAIAPGNPSKEGYIFTGWSVQDFSVVNSNLEIVAEYQKKKFTVRFFAIDGVTQIGEDYLVEYEDYANGVAPEAPAIENKYHIGWDKDVNSVKITKDTDFIAVYASETCTVTFIADGKATIVTIEKGTCVNIPNTPNKIGWVFKYWYLTDSTSRFDFSTVITTDTTINAYFEKIAEIVTVTFIGADSNQYGNVQAIVKGGKAIEPAPYDDGTLTNYAWCLLDSNVAFDFENTPITEDLVLYAKVIG